jgi:hypothetical protein
VTLRASKHYYGLAESTGNSGIEATMRTTALAPIILLIGSMVSVERAFSTAPLIKRLSPTDFPSLPASVRSELRRRRCLIPQLGGFAERSNVIRGHFKSATGIDWAALCSNGRSSVILIFIGGRTEPVDSLERSDDSNWVADNMYLRVISAASVSRTRAQWESSGYGKPPSQMHEALENSFDGKASILYFRLRNGKWIALEGAD